MEVQTLKRTQAEEETLRTPVYMYTLGCLGKHVAAANAVLERMAWDIAFLQKWFPLLTEQQLAVYGCMVLEQYIAHYDIEADHVPAMLSLEEWSDIHTRVAEWMDLPRTEDMFLVRALYSYLPVATLRLRSGVTYISDWTYEAIYEEYYRPILVYINRMLHDDEHAAELTQETFIRAWVSLPHIQGNLKVSSWLYRVATNITLDALRHRKVLLMLPLLDDSAERLFALDLSDPQTTIGVVEVMEKVRRDMPARSYAALVLHYQEGYLLPEVAHMLGLKETGMKVFMQRARDLFRLHLRAHENGFTVEQQKAHDKAMRLKRSV